MRTTRDRPPHPSPRRQKCASRWLRSIPLDLPCQPLWLQSSLASIPQPPRSPPQVVATGMTPTVLQERIDPEPHRWTRWNPPSILQHQGPAPGLSVPTDMKASSPGLLCRPPSRTQPSTLQRRSPSMMVILVVLTWMRAFSHGPPIPPQLLRITPCSTIQRQGSTLHCPRRTLLRLQLTWPRTTFPALQSCLPSGPHRHQHPGSAPDLRSPTEMKPFSCGLLSRHAKQRKLLGPEQSLGVPRGMKASFLGLLCHHLPSPNIACSITLPPIAAPPRPDPEHPELTPPIPLGLLTTWLRATSPGLPSFPLSTRHSPCFPTSTSPRLQTCWPRCPSMILTWRTPPRDDSAHNASGMLRMLDLKPRSVLRSQSLKRETATKGSSKASKSEMLSQQALCRTSLLDGQESSAPVKPPSRKLLRTTQW